jgi:XTP/dITP diphosphohydrolase
VEVILASNNRGKIKEFSNYLNQEIIPYNQIIKNIEIEENGDSFKKNAIIKAQAVFNLVDKDKYIVISDDSGISVEALNFEPGIYSARYAGVGASDKDNLQKLINNLKAKNIKSSKAFYTAAIAIVSKLGTFTVHGWMHGIVITQARGNNGFGYDPIFIPNGFNKTLGELDSDIKKNISHRYKALKLAMPIINMLKAKYG